MTAIAQQNSTSSEPLSLYVTAKQLTRFLFGEAQLPLVLQQYGQLILIITSGAAAASSLYHFFQRHKQDRAKIQLAVFHVLRMMQHLPNLPTKLQDPHGLIALMDREVMEMVKAHLTKAEGVATLKELKRKVWTVVDEQREAEREAKRRECSVKAKDVRFTKYQQPNGQKEDVKTCAQEPFRYAVPEIIVTPPPSGPLEVELQAEMQQEEDQLDISMMDAYNQRPAEKSPPSQRCSSDSTSAHRFSSSQGRSSYTYPSDSSSDKETGTPTPAPRPHNPTPHPARSGYGFSYDDKDLYSTPSPPSSISSSTNSSPPKQRSTIVGKPMSMLQTATLRASDKLSNKSPPFARPKVAKPPSTVKTRCPPVTMTTKSRGKQAGTQLFPIHEGGSPLASPLLGTAEYFVAKSKPFCRKVMSDSPGCRLTRRLLRPEVKVELVQQEQPENPMALDSKEWPAPILTYSDSEEQSGDFEDNHLPTDFSPPAPFESPPSARMISPPLPSPPSAAIMPSDSPPSVVAVTSPVRQTSAARSELRTPILTSTPPKRVVVGSSPIVLIRNASKPTTASPPKSKPGRPRKVVDELQTPSRVQTPRARRSARQSSYKGMYTK